MNNLSVVFFTNENNFQLAELAVEYLKNHSQNLKINILSNNFPQNSNFYHSDVEYHNMNIPYRYDGKHFGETMIKYLDVIEEEYIFLFCERSKNCMTFSLKDITKTIANVKSFYTP